MSSLRSGHRAPCSVLAGLASAIGLVLIVSTTPPEKARGTRHGEATRGLDCGVCHTPAGWAVRDDLRAASGFDHDLTGFPLRARHGQVACTQCHEKSVAPTRACSGCHVDEHGGKLGLSCDRCHTAASFRTTDAFKLHSQTRLPLNGMHALVDCGDCHRRAADQPFSSTPSQCFACHEADYRRPSLHPVHDGSRGAAPFPRDCATCHRTDSFVPAVIAADRFLSGGVSSLTMDPKVHDLRFVLSHGPHRGAPCASCHGESSEPRLVRCTGCHAHDRTALEAQHPRMGAPADGSCTACHPGGFAR